MELDDRIAPLARESGGLRNATWGPLMRAGNDKSLFARQVEHYADVYMSRVSNFHLRSLPRSRMIFGTSRCILRSSETFWSID